MFFATEGSLNQLQDASRLKNSAQYGTKTLSIIHIKKEAATKLPLSIFFVHFTFFLPHVLLHHPFQRDPVNFGQFFAHGFGFRVVSALRVHLGNQSAQGINELLINHLFVL